MENHTIFIWWILRRLFFSCFTIVQVHTASGILFLNLIFLYIIRPHPNNRNWSDKVAQFPKCVVWSLDLKTSFTFEISLNRNYPQPFKVWINGKKIKGGTLLFKIFKKIFIALKYFWDTIILISDEFKSKFGLKIRFLDFFNFFRFL